LRTISATEPFENAKDATLSHDSTAPVARFLSSSRDGPFAGVSVSDALARPAGATKYATHLESSENCGRDARAIFDSACAERLSRYRVSSTRRC
jgi:hypothetical protein